MKYVSKSVDPSYASQLFIKAENPIICYINKMF